MWHCVLLALSAVADGQTVLLDFYSDSCPPCRRMAPVVAALEAQGLPIRKVNVDHEPDLARQYGVSGIPCFVMLSEGREVDRVVGATEASRLAAMFNAAQPAPRSTPAPVRSAPARLASQTSPSGFDARQSAAPSAADAELTARLRDASVRIKVEDAEGFSFGSGVVVDSRDGEALVLTCGHLFRGAAPNAEVAVDLFDGPDVQTTTGRLLSADEHADVALVVVRTAGRLPCAPILPQGETVAVGDVAYAVGCDQGRDPSVWRTHVTAINKYEGPANIEAAREPVLGRSGGGLFDGQGRLIGICNAADPMDKEGLYAALPLIYRHLDAARLSNVYGASPAIAATSPAPAAMATAAAAGAGRAEVICIVRPLDRPQAPSDVYVFDRPSKDFLARLGDERSRHEGRALTSLRRPAPLDPARRADGPRDGVIRGGWRTTETVLR